MGNFEKQYYESPSFWEGSALLDEANTIRIVHTIDNIVFVIFLEKRWGMNLLISQHQVLPIN